MASWSPGFSSVHFPLWQGVISWPPSSPGGMRGISTPSWAFPRASPWCPGGLPGRARLSARASLGRLRYRGGAQLRPSLFASLCLGISWVPSPDEAPDCQLGAGETRRRGKAAAALPSCQPGASFCPGQTVAARRAGSRQWPRATQVLPGVRTWPAQVSQAPTRPSLSKPKNKGLLEESKPLKRVGVQPTPLHKLEGCCRRSPPA